MALGRNQLCPCQNGAFNTKNLTSHNAYWFGPKTGGYALLVKNLDVSLMKTTGWMLIKLGNRRPRVKPGDLDQTNGDFSTIATQLNTQCTHGHIIITKLWVFTTTGWSQYYCPMIQYLCDMMTWYKIFQHYDTEIYGFRWVFMSWNHVISMKCLYMQPWHS